MNNQDKANLLNKMSELIDNGYSFIALSQGFDNTCQNKAIVSALRSLSLPVYYNPDVLDNGNLNLAHTNTVELRQDNETRYNDSLTIVNAPESQLILTTSKDNALIGICQDYIDFTNKTGIVLKSGGNWRQERGNSELIRKLQTSNKG